ncbi:MAG: OsmC family protein [Nocardioidaceae bacterium]|nr:OsmC family protein [Nocardioidaceae bacterium]
MSRRHRYAVNVEWTGNLGEGTAGYRSYSRATKVSGESKATISGSADPEFRGDPSAWNPEELLVAALSQCHLLSYLHVCAANDVVVTAYTDSAEGTMAQTEGGAQFTEVMLHPHVRVASKSMVERAERLHVQANAACFIARSVNFPVLHQATIHLATSAGGLDPP